MAHTGAETAAERPELGVRVQNADTLRPIVEAAFSALPRLLQNRSGCREESPGAWNLRIATRGESAATVGIYASGIPGPLAQVVVIGPHGEVSADILVNRDRAGDSLFFILSSAAKVT